MDESTEVDTCSTDSNHMEKLEIGQEDTIVKCATDPSVPRQHSLNSESGRTIEGMMDNLKEGVSDLVPEEIKQSFQRLQGKVFHAIRTINGMNYMYKYRIASDGRLVLEQRLKGIYLTGQKLDETRKRLIDAGKAVPVKARRSWRKIITDDPNKRIRDYMKETPQVKMLDKFSFTLGVLTIVFSEWCLLRKPHLFPAFYAALMAFLMAWRYVDYKAQKYQLFMLDFCYFVNLSVVIQYFFFPDNREWFDVNYVMCSGPVCMAIVVWHNSLVFHSLDKVTSYFLHVLPTMVVHGVRWNTIPSPLNLDDESSLPLLTWIGHYPMAYMAWQLMYLFLTGVVFAKSLQQDPNLITSVRYLARDKKNPMAKSIKGLLLKQGIITKGPDGLPNMDPDSALAQIIFVVTQVIYTALMSLHVGLLYSYYLASSIYFVIVFSVGVWNGASFYIEVFSKRYNLKFSDKPAEVAVPSESKSNSEDKSRREVVGSSVNSSSNNLHVTRSALSESSESTEEMVDDGDDDFVEALESLDLTQPDNLRIYTDLLEHYAVGSASVSEGSSGEGSETEVSQKKTD